MRLAVLAALAVCSLSLAIAQDDPSEELVDEEAAFTGTFGDVISNAVSVWAEPEGSMATPEDIEQKALFFVGNIAWLVYHEFGHGMIFEYQLPVLGKEEDAVDSFATINMIAEEDDPALETMIIDVVDAWFQAGLYANLTYGQHSIDEQRGYAVICLLVGHDPEGYKGVADDAEMPEDRQANCKWDFQKAQESWDSVLGDNMLDDGEAPTAEVNVDYGDPGQFEAAGALLQASGVLETIAHQMENTFRLSGPITVSVEQCGQANAFFVYDERKVKVCYELANFFMEKAEEMRAEPVDAEPDEGTERPN
jgi:hypothetical protein